MRINLKTAVSLAALAAALSWALPARHDLAYAEGTDMAVTVSKLDITHGQGVEPIDQLDLILNFNNRKFPRAESARRPRTRRLRAS